jgi:hypothetical protein
MDGLRALSVLEEGSPCERQRVGADGKPVVPQGRAPAIAECDKLVLDQRHGYMRAAFRTLDGLRRSKAPIWVTNGAVGLYLSESFRVSLLAYPDLESEYMASLGYRKVEVAPRRNQKAE